MRPGSPIQFRVTKIEHTDDQRDGKFTTVEAVRVIADDTKRLATKVSFSLNGWPEGDRLRDAIREELAQRVKRIRVEESRANLIGETFTFN